MTDRNESLKIIFLDSAEQKLFIFKYRERRNWSRNILGREPNKTGTTAVWGYPEQRISERTYFHFKNGPKSSEKIAKRGVYFVFNLFSTEICHTVSLRWFYCFWNIRFWPLRIFYCKFSLIVFRILSWKFEFSLSIFLRCYRISSSAYYNRFPLWMWLVDFIFSTPVDIYSDEMSGGKLSSLPTSFMLCYHGWRWTVPKNRQFPKILWSKGAIEWWAFNIHHLAIYQFIRIL